MNFRSYYRPFGMTKFPKENDSSSSDDDMGIVKDAKKSNHVNPDALSQILDNPCASIQLVDDEKDPIAKDGYCVECEEHRASILCVQCDDQYCSICFGMLHRKGTRANHDTKMILSKTSSSSSSSSSSTTTKPSASRNNVDLTDVKKTALQEIHDDSSSSSDDDYTWRYNYYDRGYRKRKEEERTKRLANKTSNKTEKQKRIAQWFRERTKYIPMRLTMKERKLLRLLQSALTVSQYTDKIDTLQWKSLAHRSRAQLQDICALMSGLVVAADYDAGQKLIASRDFKLNQQFFQNIFEIGRRHKIMNPEKMRTEYGKLIYLLMDAAQPKMEELFGFPLSKPVKTVYTLFEERNVLAILDDPSVIHATMEIQPHGKTRHQIQKEIKQKERAQRYIAKTYANDNITSEEIRQALYSIGDNHSYLAYNRDPVDTMIALLEHFFHPEKAPAARFALGIAQGQDGARLTHTHQRQFHYCFQSLSLWREIANDMFRLWYLAELDILDGDNPYQLRDTGQGLHRVQQAPRVWKAMHSLLHLTQQKAGQWIGSAVIHLGDANVPNALMFIDKYTQVSRILNPIILTIKEIDNLVKKPGVAQYFQEAFGGPEDAKMLILSDFFRHAFDGSGADNFFDAGSCIDGRLTSAWNWCSRIEQKEYYPIFRLAGFLGFDGQFAQQ
mmetsp:Transcript_21198/g.31536  ORF Transcript_21198/g.31536 Transcript_21198/m.31536 type:complete len:670 (-) Transcript_21198:12-2021(-)